MALFVVVIEDCDLYGPAVLSIAGVAHLVECRFEGRSDSVFIVVAKQFVTGPILIESCTFKRCRFRGIGFIGPKDAQDKFLSGTMQPLISDTQDSLQAKA